MLRAYLRNRVGDLSSRLSQTTEGNSFAAWREALVSDEDTLIASVFERLAYLSPGVAWKLLSVACESLSSTDAFPSLPMKDPAWHFWPAWEPARGEDHLTRIVPDVVIEFPDLVLFCEAQLRGQHRPDLWASLIRSAQQGPYRSRRLLFVGLGGGGADERSTIAPRARELLHESGFDNVPMFHLGWDRIPAAIEVVRRSGHLHQGQLEVLKDIEAALADRGYRPRATLGTLSSLTPTSRVPTRSLVHWKPSRRQRERALGFADLEAVSFETPAQSLMHWKVRS